MSAATARLLQRLTALATSAAAFIGSQRVGYSGENVAPIAPRSAEPNNEVPAHTPKLVYGAARHGATRLAYHSSHSSHASHASHYSGSSGGGSNWLPPPPPAPNPPPTQPDHVTPETNPKPNQSSHQILDAVLKKLPNVRSHWPSTVILMHETFFTIYDNSKAVGMISLKAGTTLTLLDITPEHAIVAVSSTSSPVPVTNTDLIDRMGGAEAILALPNDPKPPPAREPAPKTPAQATSATLPNADGMPHDG